jgi:hypothetical protein
MTPAAPETAVREYLVFFEGDAAPVHVKLDVPARRLMIDNFLPAVAKVSGLASVTNREGEGHTPTDDSAAYAQVLTAAPRMAHAIRRALPWIEGTGIADPDPPEYLALRDALDWAIG